MWTKEDNIKLRQLIKEGKPPNEIRKSLGDKLEEHFNKKYLSSFSDFILNEIKMQPKETILNFQPKPSTYYPNEWNFLTYFETDSGQRYFVDFIYVKETKNQFKNDNIFNLSFTTEEQHNLNNSEIYEDDTHKYEHIEVMKRLIFVIIESIKYIKTKYINPILLIGETKNPQKINFYRNIIKDSLPNIKEIEDISDFTNGFKAYYFIFN